MRIRLKNTVPIPLKGSFSVHALWGQEYEFQRQRKYLICAGSGRGKSTLLHMLHGSRQDYDGQIIIDEEDLSLYSSNQWSKLRSTRLAFVFQDLRLFPQLTAEENLLLLEKIRPTKDLNQRIHSMAKALDIEASLAKKCSILSLGQQQRVAIIRALLQDFEFLIMDEPFSHLDEENQQRAGNLIEEVLAEKNAGLLLSGLSDDAPLSIDERINL